MSIETTGKIQNIPPDLTEKIKPPVKENEKSESSEKTRQAAEQNEHIIDKVV